MSNKSNNSSLIARLSMPNKKAKIRECKRINDPLTHYKLINSMLNDQ
jgi:hypothetical protein